MAAYFLGEAFSELASPAAIGLGVVAILIILAVPSLVLRYEKRLLAKVQAYGCRHDEMRSVARSLGAISY